MAGTSFRRREKKFSKKMQRSLDPAMLLSRGLSARFIGANVMQSLPILNKDEMEKDLRHMNAYYQANVAYAQQHYIYMNREELGAANNNNNTSGTAAPHPRSDTSGMPIAMPVRIDPEEEKRLQNLRKKIGLCETQREFLESQYVSLRAHYVATTKELAGASRASEGLVTFLQALTKKRGRVLALHRARLQIAREVLACLETRLEKLQAAGGAKTDVDVNMNVNVALEDDIAQVWNDTEERLKNAELACRKIPSSLTLNDKKSKKKPQKQGEGDDEANLGVLPWEAIKMPITPEGVPLYLSQLALVPDKGAAFGTSGVFGSNQSSMTWMEHSLPKSHNKENGTSQLTQLQNEVQLLEEELAKERKANQEIQSGIIGRRKRSDELVAMMTLLRSETEAILHRHNVLLDSPEAKQAAKDLHEESIRKRAEAADLAQAEGGDNNNNNKAEVDNTVSGSSSGGVDKKASPDKKFPAKEEGEEDEENDGDDEGDGEDYEEEGEIKGEWSGSGKRDLEEGFGDSPGNRKRRKL